MGAIITAGGFQHTQIDHAKKLHNKQYLLILCLYIFPERYRQRKGYSEIMTARPWTRRLSQPSLSVLITGRKAVALRGYQPLMGLAGAWSTGPPAEDTPSTRRLQ